MNAPVKQTEEKTSSNHHIFDYLAIILVVVGVTLFYILKINIWLKWGVVILSIIAAVGLFFLVSPTGLNLHSYIRESWRELGKVVWPTRKEAMQFTWIIFLFVLILGLFLWAVDTSLSWLLYSVILGRGN